MTNLLKKGYKLPEDGYVHINANMLERYVFF